jgi:L-lysine exporter family protein LysE/ArgO
MLSIWCAGLLSGLALIIAIGAQNAFVLRQGLRREHVGVVIMLCIASDAVLIFGGTLGVGVLVSTAPATLVLLKWVGIVYLSWWAVRSFAAALKPSALTAAVPRSTGTVVVMTLAVTYLNPHAYLDAVVVLGNLANQQGLGDRWIFAAGAVAGSALWFPFLGYGAQALSRLLSNGKTWRALDSMTGSVMLTLTIKLTLE